MRVTTHFSFYVFWFNIVQSPQDENCLNDSFVILQKKVSKCFEQTSNYFQNKKKHIQFFKIILANGFSQNWFSNNVLNRAIILVTRFNFMSLKRIGIALQFLTWHTLRFNYFYHYMYPSMDNNKMSNIAFLKKLISKQQKNKEKTLNQKNVM